ncbi:MAG: hypothetical protein P9L94_11605 [Candidatus Hinthialibacter antarcticus]|nr:hypothetical protein [Candidatus Hinthialibacter antarcticus]
MIRSGKKTSRVKTNRYGRETFKTQQINPKEDCQEERSGSIKAEDCNKKGDRQKGDLCQKENHDPKSREADCQINSEICTKSNGQTREEESHCEKETCFEQKEIRPFDGLA